LILKYRKFLLPLIFLLNSFLSTNCSDSESKLNDDPEIQTLFKKVPASKSGLTFANQIKPDYDFNILEYNYFYNGGGVATADFNNDGLPDLFFSGNMVSSAFYLNKGNLQFEEVTQISGLETNTWISGVSVVDINGDGLLDIYLCASGYANPEKRKNLLFVQQGVDANGVPKFEEQAALYGLADNGYSSQAAFFDYDLDGDFDVYIATVYHDKNNPNIPRPKLNDGSAPSTDKLYENQSEQCKTEDCQITFVDVSKKTGILKEGYGLGLAINDFNQDGWPDIFVANDFIYNDLLYINNQDGTFSEKAATAFKHQSQFSMGTDVADINNDGLPEIVVLDMLPEDNLRQKQMNIAMNYDRFLMALDNGYIPQHSRNTLQLNRGILNGKLQFSEIGQLAGIYQTDWSWSPLWADFDMDGQLDLFVSNGIPKDITDSDFIMYRDQQVRKGNFDYDALKKELLAKLEELPPVDKSNYIFKNTGDLQFKDVTADWGLKEASFSHGAVVADLDRDGDLDIVSNNLSKEVFLYENTSIQLKENNHFLKVKLIGNEENILGIGSKIRLSTSNKTYYQYYQPIRGFQSANATEVYFALGKDSIITELKVTWPDGKEEKRTNISTNQSLTFEYEKAQKTNEALEKKPTQLLFTLEEYSIDYTHTENPFIDFKFEPLLPHQYSKQGPALAIADVDGNGLEDVFIGGAVKQNGRLFLQQENGSFETKILTDENYEDTGALFFDADQDGDQDLYVVSGGNEYNPKTAPYQDRLYLNDGNGKFEKAKDALPNLYTSGNAIVSLDYDQDGDEDLFIGGRITPGNYPIPAESALLQNNGGKFTNVSQQVFKNLGLVTDALVTDFNGDDLPDLLVAGEYMPLTFLQNENGKFINITPVTGIADKKGWWNSLTQADFDQDGDIDFVAGNLGLNSRLKANDKEPVVVKASDFNKDGSLDAVLGYFIKSETGKKELFPFHSRDVLADKMRPVRRQFPTYLSFAKATLDDVTSNFNINNVYTVSANYMQSVYIENLGNNQFKLHPLPIKAQFAPINTLLSGDFNGDGYQDILTAGNSYASEFINGWYDASYGLLLAGDGNGNFTPASPQESGFYVEGETRDLKIIQNSFGQELLLVGRNSLPLLVFKINKSGKHKNQ